MSTPDADPPALSVSELNNHVKQVIEETFPPLWVAGEVTDVAKPRSGHIYFTLKDERAQVRAVMWRSIATRLRFDLENGQEILCFGSLEVYSVRGTYQLVVQKAQPQGVGSLQMAFEKLKARLGQEGLFGAERKVALPSFPRRVAVITSPSGAAIHDFLVATQSRLAAAEIFVIPAQVQGDGAAETIVRGLKAAAMVRPAIDVVVVTRGGGSIEDLWCFNEESVVRAIADCPLPTVSAIGHEVDITLSDLAADVRALTPTDAANKVFPDRQTAVGRMSDLRVRLHRSMRYAIESRRVALENLQSRPVLAKPMEMVQLRSRRVDELDQRANAAIDRGLQQAKAGIAKLAASLNALSPLNTLGRGYSVTRDEHGTTVSHAEQLSVGQEIESIFVDGVAKSTVTELKRRP